MANSSNVYPSWRVKELATENQKVRNRAYYQENKEKQKVRNKAYNQNNKDKIQAYQEKNKEKIAEQRKIHYQKNKERLLAQNKLYRENNKDKIQAYLQKNEERTKKRVKKYLEENKDKIKLRYLKKKEKYKWILEFKTTQGCLRCGENDPDCLDFDHIDPTTKEYKIADMVHSSLSKEVIMREIDKCQVLCANCHRKKTAKDRREKYGT